MAEAADFLAAIRAADPDDDGPTLIYADWLDEQGQVDHAELIRVQTAIARHDPGDVVDLDLLRRRVKELLTSELLRAITPPTTAGIEWKGPERGLVRAAAQIPVIDEKVPATIERFRLILTSEAVTQIGLSGFNEGMLARMFATPEAASITHLDFPKGYGGPTIAPADRIAALERLPRLVALGLHCAGLGDDGLADLTRARGFAGLRTLGLRGNRIGAAGLRQLERAGEGLRSLNLALNPMNTGLKPLAKGILWRQLENLDLGYNLLDADAVGLIRRGAGLQRVRRLSLRAAQIGDAGLKALCARDGLPELRVVDLNSNLLRDESVERLIDPDLFPNLGDVELRGNHFGDAALARLRARFGVGLRIDPVFVDDVERPLANRRPGIEPDEDIPF